MPRRPRRGHSPAFKAKVALAAVKGEWRERLLGGAADVSADGRPAGPPVEVKTLHAKIGDLAPENNFLDRALTRARWLSARQ
ncbi:MAG: hypothetical protein IT356_08145 [Gemmatimonadaceae bacterium]|nr:hypothetical protein [Gemmatimonadaceae bacterium]